MGALTILCAFQIRDQFKQSRRVILDASKSYVTVVAQPAAKVISLVAMVENNTTTAGFPTGITDIWLGSSGQKLAISLVGSFEQSSFASLSGRITPIDMVALALERVNFFSVLGTILSHVVTFLFTQFHAVFATPSALIFALMRAVSLWLIVLFSHLFLTARSVVRGGGDVTSVAAALLITCVEV